MSNEHPIEPLRGEQQRDEPRGSSPSRAFRLRLDGMDVAGLELELGDDALRVTLGPIAGLRGELLSNDEELDVTNAGASRCEVTTLAFDLGEVRGSVTRLELVDARGRLGRSVERFACDLEASTAGAAQVSVSAGDVTVGGRVAVEGARCQIDHDEGVVRAERVILSETVVTLTGVRLTVEQLEATDVMVAWGRDGVRIEAAIHSRGLRVVTTEAPVAFDIVTSEVSLDQLAVHRDEVDIGHVLVAGGALEAMRLAAAAPSRSPPVAEKADTSLVAAAWRLFDGVSGEVNVDLALDLTVPVLGRRRATHRFRIPIDHGTIDYMQLERDLSTFESALLDFAIRDGGLVLEMGIPFIPTRGLGKPIMRWDLDTTDLELARQQRVRIAVLPGARFAGERDEPRPSRVGLRQLELRDLDASLALARADTPEPSALPIRRVGTLALTGHVFHDPDATPRDGALLAHLEDVEVGAMSLVLGRHTVGIGLLQLALASDLEVSFLDLTPRRARLSLRDLLVDKIRIAPT